jgi:purine-binding chemotaxis protein CheW
MNTLTTDTRSTQAGKYLTFALGKESYGIAVLKVREIIRLTDITPVPQMPNYVKGVINLRGKVIPIVDLRLKFQLEEATATERTCIIVVQAAMRSGTHALMGVIVDGVEEVASIAPADVEPTPDFGTSLDTTYIVGMAKVKGGVKTLLDIDRVIGLEAIERLKDAASSE